MVRVGGARGLILRAEVRGAVCGTVGPMGVKRWGGTEGHGGEGAARSCGGLNVGSGEGGVSCRGCWKGRGEAGCLSGGQPWEGAGWEEQAE